ncbi:SPOR domain-containing protein [Butyricimonas synergistica]|uniref:SPOR domain-containing protein n=1 Tax=Butyricimonas synergistica TaxID=544644 RepID=UPI00146DD4A0|nr:SPOR domain-containing protein [Butyricimonas synergistica]
MKSILIVIILFIANQTWAQTDTITPAKPAVDFLKQLTQTDSVTGGQVTLHGDPKIEQLLKLQLSINKKEQAFQGYRIQILSSSSYNVNIDTLKSYTRRFEEEFPDIRAYLQYTDPDFKIRVGNFRTRIEAIPALKRIRKKYAGAYPVKTTIYLHELNPVQQQDTIPTLPPIHSTSSLPR